MLQKTEGKPSPEIDRGAGCSEQPENMCQRQRGQNVLDLPYLYRSARSIAA